MYSSEQFVNLSSDSIITTLVVYAINTGLFTSVCALAATICVSDPRASCFFSHSSKCLSAVESEEAWDCISGAEGK